MRYRRRAPQTDISGPLPAEQPAPEAPGRRTIGRSRSGRLGQDRIQRLGRAELRDGLVSALAGTYGPGSAEPPRGRPKRPAAEQRGESLSVDRS